MPVTAERTKRIMNAAEAKATQLGLNITICVVDDNGLTKGLLRMDGARFTTVDIAVGKARASAGTGRSNSETAERAGRPVFQFQAIHNGFLFAQGGEPIMENGEFVGAVGISGGTTGQLDEDIAKAGIEA